MAVNARTEEFQHIEVFDHPYGVCDHQGLLRQSQARRYPTAIEYIRNCLKRVRKKESAMLLASQNLEDFDQEQVREMTKPLFSIPPHQFLFNAGSIDKRSYIRRTRFAI